MTRRPPNQRMITAFGKTQNMSAWAVEYSIHPATLSKRLKTLDPETALTMATRGRPQPLTAFGKTQTMTEWALEYNLQPSNLSVRLKTMPLEQALTKPRGQRTITAKSRANPHAKRLEKLRDDLIVRAVKTQAQQGTTAFVKLLAAVDLYLDKQ